MHPGRPGQHGAYLVSDAFECALTAGTNTAGSISSEGPHWHLIYNQILPRQVGSLVI